jgi:hypothetical protein
VAPVATGSLFGPPLDVFCGGRGAETDDTQRLDLQEPGANENGGIYTEDMAIYAILIGNVLYTYIYIYTNICMYTYVRIIQVASHFWTKPILKIKIRTQNLPTSIIS